LLSQISSPSPTQSPLQPSPHPSLTYPRQICAINDNDNDNDTDTDNYSGDDDEDDDKNLVNNRQFEIIVSHHINRQIV
jgi:hypothetical protein